MNIFQELYLTEVCSIGTIKGSWTGHFCEVICICNCFCSLITTLQCWSSINQAGCCQAVHMQPRLLLLLLLSLWTANKIFLASQSMHWDTQSAENNVWGSKKTLLAAKSWWFKVYRRELTPLSLKLHQGLIWASKHISEGMILKLLKVYKYFLLLFSNRQ